MPMSPKQSLPSRSSDHNVACCLKAWIGLRLSVHENISVVQETSVSVSVGITVCLCRYNRKASVRCLGKDVSKLSPLIRLSGIPRQWCRTQLPSRCLAMDVRSDSGVPDSYSLPCVLMSHPSHYPWFRHPNATCRRVQIVKLLVTQFSLSLLLPFSSCEGQTIWLTALQQAHNLLVRSAPKKHFVS
jgi:hypothetical protein